MRVLLSAPEEASESIVRVEMPSSSAASTREKRSWFVSFKARVSKGVVIVADEDEGHT